MVKTSKTSCSFFHVLTNEGNGVAHIIIRLGKHEKRLEIADIRREVKKIQGSKTLVNIKKVGTEKDKMNLSRYVSDQRKKKRLAGEFAWQDMIESWGYSRNWLPKGFGKAFGRFWYSSRHADMGVREGFIHDWLMRSFDDGDQVRIPPEVY